MFDYVKKLTKQAIFVEGIENIEDYKAGVWYCKAERCLFVINEQGMVHNEEGPAQIMFSMNNEVVSIVWKVNDLAHRLDGPAFYYFGSGQNLVSSSYTINNEYITEEMFWKHPLVLEHKLNSKLNSILNKL